MRKGFDDNHGVMYSFVGDDPGPSKGSKTNWQYKPPTVNFPILSPV